MPPKTARPAVAAAGRGGTVVGQTTSASYHAARSVASDDAIVVIRPAQLDEIRDRLDLLVELTSDWRAAPALLTARELAQSLRCSVVTVGRQVAEGMPCLMLGSERRYELQSVIAWLRTRKEAARAR